MTTMSLGASSLSFSQMMLSLESLVASHVCRITLLMNVCKCECVSVHENLKNARVSYIFLPPSLSLRAGLSFSPPPLSI
jgi:hypothetical protein